MLLSINRDLHARKLRLFACACARRLWRYLNDPLSRNAVEVAERYADHLAGRRELALAQQKAGPAAHGKAKTVAFHAASDDAWSAACMAIFASARGTPSIKASHAELLRDIFRHPSRPILVPHSWLSWEGGIVTQLAQSIYEERAFDRMPILADALEEAGCTNGRLLHHCREDSEHFRGCWALDAILGKE
jgi:hypothetical protein